MKTILQHTKLFALVTLSCCFIFTLAATGCSVNKPIEKQQYLLSITNPKFATTSKIKCAHSKQLLVLNATTANPPFAQQNFLYRISDSRYLVDYYRSFLTSPNQQLDALLEKYFHCKKNVSISYEQINNTTPPPPSPPITTQNNNIAANKETPLQLQVAPLHEKKRKEQQTEQSVPKIEQELLLNTKILELYADYRIHNQPRAVIALNVNIARHITTTIGRKTEEQTITVADKNLRVAIPLATKNTESLLASWGKGLESLLNQIGHIILAQYSSPQ
jgi:hypothetical protein